MDEVFIRLLGEFSITVNGQIHDHLLSKSRKGVSLLTYLVLQGEKPVSTQRLIREMWNTKGSCNPDSALKTMVSRFRALLNELSPGLGSCIQCSQSSYRWKCAPGVRVDVIEFSRLLEKLKETQTDGERITLSRQIMELYRGDLIQTGELVNGVIQSSWMHREYLEAMYAYVHMLEERGDYAEISAVCKQGLQVDGLDDFFRIESAHALACLDQAEKSASDALPEEDDYREISQSSQALHHQLEAVRRELQTQEHAPDHNGPFFCDYPAFKEFYNVQIRNLRRLGSTMFLGVILVGGKKGALSDVSQESAMAGLIEILRRNLRKGDIVTRFSPDIVAMLLPTVNYSTGCMVLERIEKLFYGEYPSSLVSMHHRLTPLGS